MVEPIRPSTLWLLPFSSIDRDHGCDAAASVLGSDRLRVIRRIGQDFFRSGDRASDRAVTIENAVTVEWYTMAS